MRCWWPCGVVTPRSSWTAARCAPSVAGSLPVPTQRTGPNGARNTTSRSPARDHRRAITGDGIPVACAATAANVNDALVFERLFLSAFAVMARIATVFADKGYDAEANRILCRRFGAEPHIHKPTHPQAHTSTSVDGHTGRAWASDAGRSSAAMPGGWRTSAWRGATTASASSFKPCSRPRAYPWSQGASLANSENRLLSAVSVSIHSLS